MKSEFLRAITQLSAEKNLSSEVVIAAVEAALVSAYRKENFTPNQNISVKVNPMSGKVQVWAEKTVVERASDMRCEISLEEARRIKSNVQIGETVRLEATPYNAGRIAAQTAKQVILQRLHEAERNAIVEEYTGREGDIVTGLVQHIEPKQVFIDLGRAEAVLSAAEQMPSEKYRLGQRLKVVILEVAQITRGPRVMVSRAHPNLLRRLFEMEVPEIYNGVVEVKAIAREAGSRSKVAVAALQEGVDPVGCCVGLRGIRIQNIVSELGGEKIDVVMWRPNAAGFIANALSPAQILNIELSKREGIATVVVPDRQLSLAIGREGQNVRLAVKLTGWRIDIKSASAAEAERAALVKPLAVLEEETLIEEEVPAEALVPEPVLTTAEVAQPLPALDAASPPSSFESLVAVKPDLRFAEDILPSRLSKPQAAKAKKKKRQEREGDEAKGRVKKSRWEPELDEEDEDDEEYSSANLPGLSQGET